MDRSIDQEIQCFTPHLSLTTRSALKVDAFNFAKLQKTRQYVSFPPGPNWSFECVGVK